MYFGDEEFYIVRKRFFFLKFVCKSFFFKKAPLSKNEIFFHSLKICIRVILFEVVLPDSELFTVRKVKFFFFLNFEPIQIEFLHCCDEEKYTLLILFDC